jgi:hypothetical protein
MDELMHVGFDSETLTFTKDITVDELIDLLVDFAPTIEEALRAADVLEGPWDAGRFKGTGYSFWFVRPDPIKILH